MRRSFSDTQSHLAERILPTMVRPQSTAASMSTQKRMDGLLTKHTHTHTLAIARYVSCWCPSVVCTVVVFPKREMDPSSSKVGQEERRRRRREKDKKRRQLRKSEELTGSILRRSEELSGSLGESSLCPAIPHHARWRAAFRDATEL